MKNADRDCIHVLHGGPPGYRREFGQWIKEAEVLLERLSRAGFTFVAFTHSYQSAGSGGIQPLVLVSRLAPISGDLRLATQVVLLPLMNGMDAAYNAVTLDHITEGRLDLGIGLGYHPWSWNPSAYPGPTGCPSSKSRCA